MAGDPSMTTNWRHLYLAFSERFDFYASNFLIAGVMLLGVRMEAWDLRVAGSWLLLTGLVTLVRMVIDLIVLGRDPGEDDDG
jgi:uncharacterized membrane protein YadS